MSSIPTHIVLWAVYNGLTIILSFLGKNGTDRAIGGGFSAGAGILSVALVSGGASGLFLTLEVARWAFMLGLALLAAAVTVGPETKSMIGPLALSASMRMAFAAVTWLYML